MSTLLEVIKSKKYGIANTYGNYLWNHPNRIEEIALSGNLSFTIDGRDFSGAGLSATVYVFSLDFTLAEIYSRIFEPNTPWQLAGSSNIPSGAPAAGNFVWAHRPISAMWAFEVYCTQVNSVNIGDCTATVWTRVSYSDPWVEGSSTTTDIAFDFFPFVAYSGFQKGGEPDSGGKGDSSDDEKVQIRASFAFSGTNSGSLNVMFSSLLDLFRLPWDDIWSSETEIFETAFDDYVDNQNTLLGGGHSGSCTISLDFA